MCLTGGSLGFDGRTLISPENSRKMEGLANRRISPKQAHYFMSQQSPSTVSLQLVLTVLCVHLTLNAKMTWSDFLKHMAVFCFVFLFFEFLEKN